MPPAEAPWTRYRDWRFVTHIVYADGFQFFGDRTFLVDHVCFKLIELYLFTRCETGLKRAGRSGVAQSALSSPQLYRSMSLANTRRA